MKEKFSLAMDIGEQMLLSGAEVARAEESIKRMCEALGFQRTDVFFITSQMQATVYFGEEFITQTRRISSIAADYEKLHRLNELSRKICIETLSAEEIREELKKAIETKTYPLWVECLAYSVIAGAFTLFFGGNLVETGISAAAGLIIRLVIFLLEKYMSNKIFVKFVSSLLSTALAVLAVKTGAVETVDKIIIGNIMTLIPGIGLTNALRDLFIGDSIAGILRMLEAVLLALAIAAGYFAVVFLGGMAL